MSESAALIMLILLSAASGMIAARLSVITRWPIDTGHAYADGLFNTMAWVLMIATSQVVLSGFLRWLLVP